MEIDKTTFNDLSIFNEQEDASIFTRLNYTKTNGGREWLVRFFSEPLNDIRKIVEVQDILKLILRKEKEWPQTISNGTVMVIERFYESPIDSIPSTHGFLNAFTYKILHNPDFSLVRYSIGHFADFLTGIRQLVELFSKEEIPGPLKSFITRAASLITHPVIVKLTGRKSGDKFSASETLQFGHHVLYHFKNTANELINIFSRIEAWYSMAIAARHHRFCFPEFIFQDQSLVEARSLYHILLPKPVTYDIKLTPVNNFIFLTGANMAGKSTFIKSVGAAVYLAHLGMGVPAEGMKLSLFNGILSNINVVDNIVRGESYFFNEVQRIKKTILKINDGKKWLVLIDELFKGTNVQDAMKCSSAVVKGLIKIKNSLFILSTHLYEIGEELKAYPNISFRYFETNVKEDELEFSYQLKEGISNDRLGYLILKRERVVELLESL